LIYSMLASEYVAKIPLTSSRLGRLSICLSLKLYSTCSALNSEV
jgi:hypothetical protein